MKRRSAGAEGVESAYIARLKDCFGGADLEEANEIVQDVREHIENALAEFEEKEISAEQMERVLARLGAPEEYGTELAATAGSVPPDTGDGDGGTVLCTVLYEKGIMPNEIYQKDSEYGRNLPHEVLDGYHFWAITVAGWMTRSNLILKIMEKPVMAWGRHIAGERNLFGCICEKIGIPVCKLIGKLNKKKLNWSIV